jgi:hypothetical protein
MEHKCVECEEAITNPICPKCLGREIKVWLKEKLPEIAHITEISPQYGTGTSCMFCGRDIAVCAHCVSKDIYLEVTALKPELSEDFISCFNFELREEFE